MLNHEESTELLDATMGVLEADITNETPQSGTGVIDQWIQQLSQADNTKDLTDTLERLKTHLKSEQTNSSELSQLLETLSTQTAEFSTRMGSEGDIAPRLEGLSSALRSMAGQISNK
ncbi:hypothetical protein [Spirosoma montaniterrae]|uniref:Uncharacterized protein n=1 Tax=Spirosoma montaniterrae TaxID=1178516 RepID=A0A1P9X0D8_9BACT|nr:hypothetical protein [Spirosoma montaniterrae]AQG81045.1 hypothetical protein AWR27_17995 [Spirosoma montaniterrae]